MDHVYREGNRVVDDLAKHRHDVENNITWNDVRQTTPSIWLLVEIECKHNGTL